MANLHVKNVPDALHRKIHAYARRRGQTVRDVVLHAVSREIEREEFTARLAKREPVELGRAAARSLAEVRAKRDRDLGGCSSSSIRRGRSSIVCERPSGSV